MDKLKGAVIALSIVALVQLIAWYGANNHGSYILQSTDCK